ncbi:MAG: hypothetical protein C0506_10455 [Anaerolinea sp.]|nr:hypothetical protein [Anaerolinea sp.]
MSDAALSLETMLNLLLEEESALRRLVGLAIQEQGALVDSDYGAIERVSNAMHAASDRIEALEQQRVKLAAGLGNAEATLEELLPLAEELGIHGLAESRLRLAALAAELQEAQEHNARLLLSAVKLRERWVNHIAGMAPSTYGSEGKQHLSQARGMVSRSA